MCRWDFFDFIIVIGNVDGHCPMMASAGNMRNTRRIWATQLDAPTGFLGGQNAKRNIRNDQRMSSGGLASSAPETDHVLPSYVLYPSCSTPGYPLGLMIH